MQRETKQKQKTMQCEGAASKGKQSRSRKLSNARVRQAKGNNAEAIKPNLRARYDKLGKQCMQCKLQGNE